MGAYALSPIFFYLSSGTLTGARHGPARVAYWGCPEEPLGAERGGRGAYALSPIINLVSLGLYKLNAMEKTFQTNLIVGH